MRFFLIIIGLGIIGTVSLHFLSEPKVSNLESFIELTRQDPLFYSPFFDTAAFSASIKRLTESEIRLKAAALQNLAASASPQKELYATILKEHELFPQAFLSILGDISQTTEQFFIDPSPDTALKLITLYEQGATEYTKAATAGLEALTQASANTPSDRPLIYFFADSATTLNIIRSDYELIIQNGQALQVEIIQRKACLLGTGPCTKPLVSSDIKDFLSILETKSPNFDSAAANLVRDTLPYASLAREIRGPYPVSSSCWRGDANHWLYLIYAEENKIPKVLPKLAEQNYYLLVQKNAPDHLSQAFSRAGYAFYNQPETTTYECTDLSFYPQLLVLDFVKKKLENEKLSLEEAAADPDIVHLVHNQFSLLSPVLNLIADTNDLLETSQRVNAGSILSPQFLFVTRSAYSLTYLPFASSVWRIAEKPKYLFSREELTQIKAPPQFKTYTELKEYGFTDEEIRKSHVNQKEFIGALINN